MGRAAFIYSEDLSGHVLRDGHPMRPIRLKWTHDLLDALGAFSTRKSKVIKPISATDEDILSSHTRDYLNVVKNLSGGTALEKAELFGFSSVGDNPIYDGMYEAALLSTGASLMATDLALSGDVDVAFSISGGLHHAMPASASGFCIFNDPVVVINTLLNRGLRVVYLDIDAHHGDGVQHSFYDKDSVLTISLHESGQNLFPGTGSVDEKGMGNGEGYSVNLPLAPYTGDEIYNWAFENIVPPLIDAFGPDCVVTQLGIDTYHSDPLTHLYLSSEGFVSIIRSIKNIAHGLPWIALGGGGYNLSAVARCWSLAYGVMSDQCLSDDLPESQKGHLGTEKLRDVFTPELPGKVVEATRQFAEISVETVKKTIFPYHI